MRRLWALGATVAVASCSQSGQSVTCVRSERQLVMEYDPLGSFTHPGVPHVGDFRSEWKDVCLQYSAPTPQGEKEAP